jgi:hypothetical protein
LRFKGKGLLNLEIKYQQLNEKGRHFGGGEVAQW